MSAVSCVASLSPGLADLATQIALPIAVAPIDSPFMALDQPGQRLLVARDGIYLEVLSPSLYARTRIGTLQSPYGELNECLTLPHGPIPASILMQLADLALSAHPHEMAALVLAD
ncbi:protein containing Domain of unknown function DUF2016, partial [mine drainage metagenome]